MRNEALYAVEWIAYHRLIGFDEIIVCSNGCTDGTDLLLDGLEAIGWLRHIPNPTPDGVSPQLHASSRVGESLPWSEGDWIMWLDTDEFLNIHTGDGQVSALLQALTDADGYAVHWRLFGDSDLPQWQSAPTPERFTRCGRARAELHEPVKTLFRWSASIEGLHTHRPILRPSFRERGLRWLHGAGEEVPEVFYYHRYNQDSAPALRLPWVTGQFAWAQVNHYAVRTRPEFERKRQRRSGVYSDRHQDDAYWGFYNLNDQTDTSIQRHLPELTALMEEALSHPGIRQIHDAAIADMQRQTSPQR